MRLRQLFSRAPLASETRETRAILRRISRDVTRGARARQRSVRIQTDRSRRAVATTPTAASCARCVSESRTAQSECRRAYRNATKSIAS